MVELSAFFVSQHFIFFCTELEKLIFPTDSHLFTNTVIVATTWLAWQFFFQIEGDGLISCPGQKINAREKDVVSSVYTNIYTRHIPLGQSSRSNPQGFIRVQHIKKDQLLVDLFLCATRGQTWCNSARSVPRNRALFNYEIKLARCGESRGNTTPSLGLRQVYLERFIMTELATEAASEYKICDLYLRF